MPRSRQRSQGRVTIIDVAKMAGVSTTTVSNALNRRLDSMTPETLQRIEASIQMLGYKRNSLARSMVTRRTATIGVMLVEIETPLFLRSLNVIEPMARSAGFNLLLCIARSEKDESEALDLLLEKQVEGVIFVSTSQVFDDRHISALRASSLPVVLVNRTTSDVNLDQIHWDNVAGSKAMVRHLAAAGHQRIAHLLGPEKRRSTDERYEGYRQGLVETGLEWDAGLIRPGDYTADAVLWRASTLELLALKEPPTAIIASDDIVAATVMRTLHAAGLSIPGDIAVAGIDDQPFCTFLDPTLTTLRLPILEASRLATEIILERIAGDTGPARLETLPCEVVVRESTTVQRPTAIAGNIADHMLLSEEGR